jgi:hypothetical protein
VLMISFVGHKLLKMHACICLGGRGEQQASLI